MRHKLEKNFYEERISKDVLVDLRDLLLMDREQSKVYIGTRWSDDFPYSGDEWHSMDIWNRMKCSIEEGECSVFVLPKKFNKTPDE